MGTVHAIRQDEAATLAAAAAAFQDTLDHPETRPAAPAGRTPRRFARCGPSSATAPS